MADPQPTPSQNSDPQKPEPIKPSPQHDPPPSSDPTPPPPPQSQQQQQSSTPPPPNPNPTLLTPPQLIPGYTAPPHMFTGAAPPSVAALPPGTPAFRPLPQFSPLPGFQQAPTLGVQPPGVAPQVMTSGAVPMMPYQVPPGQPINPAFRLQYMPVPNGVPRYPTPYPAMVRPVPAMRPPGAPGVLPVVARPLIPGFPAVRPPPSLIRPVIPSVTPAEKPQTTVYVGKIASTVENDFLQSILEICGPIKSWKRAHDPNGTPRGFGFCEFESAEGVLRALRLLSKFNIDGQELVLNVTQGTREYLERFVERKTENSKNLRETQASGADKDDGTEQGVNGSEPPKSSMEDPKNEGDKGNKENSDMASFGIVTNEDKEGDREAMEKLTGMIEERLKTHPLPPPPPPPPAIAPGDLNSETLAKPKDGDDDVDMRRKDAAEDKDEEESSDNKATGEHGRADAGSPEGSWRNDRRSRERDRERDLKREQERELERYEREAERERARQKRRMEEAEREYLKRIEDWEYREREKEKQRQYEKEKEKERERKRRKEILHDEEEDEDDSRKRWRRSVIEDRRKKRQREKEDDLADRLKEEEEIAEAKKRAEEEKLQQQLQRDALNLLHGHAVSENDKKVLVEETLSETKNKVIEPNYEGDSNNENHKGELFLSNGTGGELISSMDETDTRQGGNAPAKKLGFGLVGSGKRTAVPSVFHEEEDDDVHKDKKMRPLVPIDYSTEELQAVQPATSVAQPPNLVAAAEFAKRLSNVTPKEEKLDSDRERSRHRSNRDKDRSDDDASRNRDASKERIHDREREREHLTDKVKTPDKQKLLDAKQLIDMIPKTKDELFSYEINWDVYDNHQLHERMRPWISKKIMEFLGEEEPTLVDYIVTSTQEHVKASQMLEMLQGILDEEAEMFVLKMWRMLIFEIKKVETGLTTKSRT